MILAADIGNTNIVFGLFKNNKLTKTFRLETRRDASVQYYIDFFKKSKIDVTKISSVIVCSVVPQTKKSFTIFCRNHIKCKPFEVADHLNNLGINIKIDNPKQVGADRIVNAIAFYKKYKTAGIIIDFGTATTFDVVDDRGNYLGGMISPGINLALSALSQAAAKLPKIRIVKPVKPIGKSTISAMQSGVYYGYLGLIERSVKEISVQMNKIGIKQKPVIIATGGLAKFFSQESVIDYLEKNLTLEGLYIITKKIY